MTVFLNVHYIRSLRRLFTALMLICVAALASCGGSHTSSSTSGGDEIRMRYSDLLRISEFPGYTEVKVLNPRDTMETLHSYVLVHKDSVVPSDLPKGTLIRIPVDNALVYSTVHAGILSEMNAGDAIGGVCGSEYIKEPRLKERIESGSIIDCGYSQNPDIEKIIKLRPEIIMLSPYENNDQYAKVGTLGIPIMECADYMEETPLGRAEWMRLYGLLFGKKDISEKMFADTEAEYMRLKELASEEKDRPTVLIDQRYGQVWYVPGGKSLMNCLINDAGGRNPFESYGGLSSVALAPEKVLAEAHDADVWLVRYNQTTEKTLAELAKDSPVNSHFKAYKEGNVYGCNTRYINFYEETPYHPDRLLRDMISVLHPDVAGVDTIPVYYSKMP